MHYLGRYFLL